MKFRVEPVCAPFPYVASHGVKIKAVGRKCIHRACACVAIVGSVILREFSLPYIAEMLSIGTELISPGVQFLFKSTARGILPLRFRRQPFPEPLRECCGVI